MKILKKLSYVTLFVLVALQSSNLKAQEPQTSWWDTVSSVAKPLFYTTVGIYYCWNTFSIAESHARLQQKYQDLATVCDLERDHLSTGVQAKDIRTYNRIHDRYEPNRPYDLKLVGIKIPEERFLAKTTDLKNIIKQDLNTQFEQEKFESRENAAEIIKERTSIFTEQTRYNERAQDNRRVKKTFYGASAFCALATIGYIGYCFVPKKD